MKSPQETTLEIDLTALKKNIAFLKSKLTPNTKFLAVVKAYSYGHNAEPLALFLQNEANVDYFAVAYSYEGIALRKAGITNPILVLHPLPIHFKDIIDNCLEPNLYSKRILNEFIAIAEKEKQQNYPVHIKFNTGLNRLGFNESETANIITTAQKTTAIQLKGLLSHLAASEDPNEKKFTLNQINSFKRIANTITSKLNITPMLHICNTSGILNYPEAHLDMVRSGIGMFGFGNNPIYKNKLTPIATLKTVISQIHTIKKGESLGYNRKFIANSPMQTATLPLGHADGLSRIYGKGNGFVFINNKKAAVLGNTCMDMIMVDVTDIKCNEGDEVIIFGKNHSAEDLAESAGTIAYELLTDMSQRIKRVFHR